MYKINIPVDTEKTILELNLDDYDISTNLLIKQTKPDDIMLEKKISTKHLLETIQILYKEINVLKHEIQFKK